MNYEALWHRLTPLYEADEAKAIVRWVLDVRFSLSWADILCGKVTELSANDQTELEKIIFRLEKGEPVQYVIGVADFCGRQFHVEPGVLIPRPETAELCRLIHATNIHGQTQKHLKTPCHSDVNILDIGTGSGCIAISLSLGLPDAKIFACDISEKALNIAKINNEKLQGRVSFFHTDILSYQPPTTEIGVYDAIVSNPPYITIKEADTMAPNVLNYEPHEALFVPNDDPMLFYHKIGSLGLNMLKPNGLLAFEINRAYGQVVKELLVSQGYQDVRLMQDLSHNNRFVFARLTIKQK